MPAYFYHLSLELLVASDNRRGSRGRGRDSGDNKKNNNDNDNDKEKREESISISGRQRQRQRQSSWLGDCGGDFPASGDSGETCASELAIEAVGEALRPFRIRGRKGRRGAGKDKNAQRQSQALSGSGMNHSNNTQQQSQQQTVIDSTASSSSNNHNHTQQTSSSLQTDKRLDEISIQSIDMVLPDRSQSPQQHEQHAHQPPSSTDALSKSTSNSSTSTNSNQIAKGIGTNVIGGLATKGKYVPLDQKVSDSVWGIVHLYRDAEETPALYKDDNDEDAAYLKGSSLARGAGIGGAGNRKQYGSADVVGEEAGSTSASALVQAQAHPVGDCTTLCILAVPSYLSPPDFLGFVGEETRDEVSHFRMIRTARANRYMVLMKFRSGRKAREWQREWNGKVFNSMEPETCHVVFVKTVEIQVEAPGSEGKFPDMSNDPFTPSSSSAQATSLSTKPLAPPTPSLIELPTCPVCLERMDETTGLLTIICQHVFHCTCLQKWKGSGCPVCRYTQDEFGKRAQSFAGLDQAGGPTECTVCHSELNLWLCLICGNVGCGRYDEAHAFAHFKETGHTFAMDLDTQRVWDYVGDGYVHRIIQNKSDGKLVELPAAGPGESALDPPDWADAVPREKLENMSVEYTHLLTSQLESQRAYFEEVVERAADKASVASAAATAAQEAAERATASLAKLQAQHDTLVNELVPSLERDKARLERRAEKFETMARNMEKEWREEKAMNGSLMEKVAFLDGEVGRLKVENEDLKEQNRDLSFFISGAEKLKELAAEEGEGEGGGGGLAEDVVGGTVSVPEAEEGGKKKKKGKGRGRK
ncbi:hypothetical protein FQN55_003964 [Onygenales sp. PD_40]|nr:hypothetical protein FQN55_003964 [Onygenales sp. PD_40]KAK2786972.1 hypothetical protein FQN52_007414 [Onygenales sp. PD_12]